MPIKEAVLQHYRGYEELIKRLEDALRQYERSRRAQTLDFMGPDEMSVTESYIGNRAPYQMFGGYPQALKKRLVIGDDLCEEDYISCLKAEYNSRFENLSHRDLLGSVHALGLEIEKFGDMWVRDGQMYLYVVSELSYTVSQSLLKVSRCNVRFQEVPFAAQKFEFDLQKAVVSSLRLDSVISGVIRRSREKAKEMISHGLVNVNYKTIEDCTHVCNNNDILSIRMFGRFQIDNIDINQRSGKYNILVRKFK